MSVSMLLGVFDWVADFFKALFDMIPKIIYLLYSSLACCLDVLQLFFRKLAGLDVYYIDGKPQTGDLVTNFIGGILGININGVQDSTDYSSLSTVFWAFVVFGIIICFVSVFVAIIKSHYSYDDKAAKGPMQFVYTGVKSIINMVAVPVIIMLGLYVSQALLTAVDTITSTNSGTIAELYGDKRDLLESVATSDKIKTGPNGELIEVANRDKTYIYYDIFGFGGAVVYGEKALFEDEWYEVPYKTMTLIGAKTQTFSGSMFRVAAYNANRARLGQIKPKSNISGTKDGEIFSNATTSDTLAEMIDTAFACNLHLKESMYLDQYSAGWDSLKYFTNFLTWRTSAFSKFNVGLVWHYYDLWQFNFIVGFAGVIVCVSLFINIILGLMTRLFICVGLFIIMPPLFGLAPLDGGEATKNWKKNFTQNVLMTYGAVVGMNVMFLILPLVNNIDFFNIGIADYFARALMLIVGLITVKAFIDVVSGIIGGANAEKSGAGISEEVGKVAGQATKMTIGASKIGAKLTPVGIGASINAGIKNKKKKAEEGKLKTAQEDHNKLLTAKRQDDFMREHLRNMKGGQFDADVLEAQAREAGFSDEEITNMRSAAQSAATAAGATGNISMTQVRNDLAGVDTNYANQMSKFTKTVGGRLVADNSGYNKELAKSQNRIAGAQASVKTATNRYKKATNNALYNLSGGTWKDAGKTAIGNIGDMFGESKVVSGFKDKIWKKPDYAKQTAENTGKLLETAGGIQSDMRQGFDSVNDTVSGGFNQTNKNLGGINRNMQKGFGDVSTRIDSTNTVLSGIAASNAAIEADTAKIKKATQRAAQELQGHATRQKKLLAEQKQANKKLEQVKDKATELLRRTPKP